METRITVNGVEYASIDDMPPDVRAAYQRALSMLADRNNNGVPDIVEGANVQVSGDSKNVSVTSVTSTTFDTANWKDVPQDMKQKLSELAKTDGVSFDLNVGMHRRMPRHPAKSRSRALQTLFVLAVVLTIAWIMWMLRRT